MELHPYFPQAEQRAWDKAHGIVTQAWSPLGRANQLLHVPAIKAVADRHGKTIPQVILRWHVQLGAIPLPKAASEVRQIENFSVFDFELKPGIWTRSRRSHAPADGPSIRILPGMRSSEFFNFRTGMK